MQGKSCFTRGKVLLLFLSLKKMLKTLTSLVFLGSDYESGDSEEEESEEEVGEDGVVRRVKKKKKKRGEISKSNKLFIFSQCNHHYILYGKRKKKDILVKERYLYMYIKIHSFHM